MEQSFGRIRRILLMHPLMELTERGRRLSPAAASLKLWQRPRLLDEPRLKNLENDVGDI